MPLKESGAKISNNSILAKGKYPVVSQNADRLIDGYSNEARCVKELPVVLFGDHNCVFKYIDFEFLRGADGTKILKFNQDILPKYFYFISSFLEIPEKNKYKRHFKELKEIKIPVPKDIEIQKKIISEYEVLEDEISKREARLKELEGAYGKILSEYL